MVVVAVVGAWVVDDLSAVVQKPAWNPHSVAGHSGMQCTGLIVEDPLLFTDVTAVGNKVISAAREDAARAEDGTDLWLEVGFCDLSVQVCDVGVDHQLPEVCLLLHHLLPHRPEEAFALLRAVGQPVALVLGVQEVDVVLGLAKGGYQANVGDHHVGSVPAADAGAVGSGGPAGIEARQQEARAHPIAAGRLKVVLDRLPGGSVFGLGIH
mmetsp:Transcript_25501/g.71325  ORF Transcript_25501/g.71325 Transcript_25501/m.71325 type:complete len:210 (-) Transcript_25501:194-823(-)